MDAGSRLVVVSQTGVHLPLSAVGMRAGDVVKGDSLSDAT